MKKEHIIVEKGIIKEKKDKLNKNKKIMNKTIKKDKKIEKLWKYERKSKIIGRIIKLYLKWTFAIL